MKKYTEEKVCYSIHNTSFGKMLFASTEKGICVSEFLNDSEECNLRVRLSNLLKCKNIIENKEKNMDAARQIEEYYSGKRQRFDLKLHLVGTPFRIKVWEILKNIKYGEVWTYKDVAVKLGDTKKCRAVGGAIGKNPVGVIIPCHRVIGSNGRLTGFSAPGGIVLKKRLLDLEKQNL
jgi:O-6-methylguanine DNA methyltransferase